MQQDTNNEKLIKQLSQKQQSWQMFKFTLFSASAAVIQIGSYALLSSLFHLTYWPAYIISLVLSVLWNFTFNRRYTFRSVANVSKAMSLVFLYYLVFTPLSTWWGDALTKAGWFDYLVLIGTMLINFVTEYLYQRFVVYRYTVDTNELAQKAEEAQKAKDAKMAQEAGKALDTVTEATQSNVEVTQE